MNVSEAFWPLLLVLLMALFVVPYIHKLWRNWYWDINDKSEGEWDKMKKTLHNESLKPKTKEQKDKDFEAHTKSLVVDYINKTKKAKYWTNYFLIFTVIMGGQLLYAVSHLLNQYYGIPSIGDVNATSLKAAAFMLIYTLIMLGIYFYKKRDLKERQALLAGLANEYSLEGDLTLEKLAKTDMSTHKENLPKATY